MNAEMYRELALHPEVSFEMRVANTNSEIQTQQIRELAGSGIDLLIVSPNESKPLTPVIEEVYKAGIPVILIDRKTDSNTTPLTSERIIMRSENGGKVHHQSVQLRAGYRDTDDDDHLARHRYRNRGFRMDWRIPGMEVVDSVEVKFDIGMLDDRLPPF